MSFANTPLDSVHDAAVLQLNAYYEGMKEGIRMCAYPDGNGNWFVRGIKEMTLNDALKEIDSMRAARLEKIWKPTQQDDRQF